jgi:hypothetical protein
MIFIEDLVGDPGAVDATKDFDKGVTIGRRKIWRESTIAGSGKKTLKKSSDFHSAETGGHSFKAVIREELVLEEAEESKEGGIGWDIASVNEDKGIVGDKHLG